MIILNKNQILFLYSQLIAETGGLDGIRDETCLIQHLMHRSNPLMMLMCIAKGCKTWLRID